MKGRIAGLALTLAVLAVAWLALSACGKDASQPSPATSPSPAGSSPAPTPDAASTAWQAKSALQTQLLRSFVYSAQAWSYEPRGDVPSSSDVSSTLILAKVLALPEGAKRVAFDCYQLYIGRSATRAATEDGHDPAAMNSPVYVRNRFKHRQELPVAADCPVVTTIDGDRVLNGFDRRYARSGLFYWLVVGSDSKVHGALWQPTY